ncbi:hypothetical protein QBC46DRAFT_430759 [Diplogelasinospora grovesii]|uniref:Uncharacterized protein n=1 Tax=Diplogelasinospora grovesii TaxID=303347 RepID=A0AAN6RYV1_9PEZI|nr:hypothetical protein QBC46DRAFT_430759 [Diplogelasinospora grovesii]
MASFDGIYHHLTSKYGYPVLANPSNKPYDPALTNAISDLLLHPTLEATLHILNGDLPSAHFLCRHMQNKPAFEGMYLHGILHRVEGDYRNAEAWYNDVHESEPYKAEGLEDGKGFIGRVEKLRKEKRGDPKQLERESAKEIDALVQWLKQKFGTQRMQDVSNYWPETSEEQRKMAAHQVVGGEGIRQF